MLSPLSTPVAASPPPLVVDAVVETLANDPVLVGLMVVLFLVVIFGYLYVRRTLSNLREGYDDAYRR